MTWTRCIVSAYVKLALTSFPKFIKSWFAFLCNLTFLNCYYFTTHEYKVIYYFTAIKSVLSVYSLYSHRRWISFAVLLVHWKNKILISSSLRILIPACGCFRTQFEYVSNTHHLTPTQILLRILCGGIDYSETTHNGYRLLNSSDFKFVLCEISLGLSKTENSALGLNVSTFSCCVGVGLRHRPNAFLSIIL